MRRLLIFIGGVMLVTGLFVSGSGDVVVPVYPDEPVHFIEGGPPYVEMRPRASEAEMLKGAHFNIYPGAPGWDVDVATAIIRDLAQRGFTTLLIFVQPDDVGHPNFRAVVEAAQRGGIRVIVRLNVKFGELRMDDTRAEITAAAIRALRDTHNVRTVQVLNEADMFWDWDWGRLCNPNNASALPDMMSVDMAANCGRWFGECAEGVQIVQCMKNNPFVALHSTWYWELYRRSIPGIMALGMFAAAELNPVYERLYKVGYYFDQVAYRPPDVEFVIPPVAKGPLTDQVARQYVQDYYQGYFAYWTSYRTSWPYGAPAGSWGGIAAIVSKVAVFHIYSAENLGGICSSNAGGAVVANANAVVEESLRAMEVVREAAMEDRFYSLRFPIRNIVVTEAGPSPELLGEFCQGDLQQAMFAWASAASSLSAERGGPPILVWVATFNSLTQTPPTGEMAYWEITALYPYQRCSGDFSRCFTGKQ